MIPFPVFANRIGKCWKLGGRKVRFCMPPKREMILQRLRAGLPDLRREFPLGRLALFGSVVRDEAAGDSDIDILVEVEPSIGLAFVTLADRLESLIGHKVDLVSRRAIKPLLWKQIEPELIDV